MYDRQRLLKYAWLSGAAAVATIGLKAGAYWLTGSVGLLSDALESLVNLVSALLTLFALSIAALPPDEEHSYGHDKAEYFSSGVVGALIVIAALTIGYTAIRSLLRPEPLEQLGIGLLISLAAALLNLVVGLVLVRAGRREHSIALEADGQHLLADVWTSGGVLLGLTAVWLTGWQPLDPIIALLVALNIVRSGVRLISRAVYGLMDTALPPQELARVEAVLNSYCDQGIAYHALRTRQAGIQRFVSVHLQVPGAWTVQAAHALVEEIERDLRDEIMPLSVLIHLEPIEDPVSWLDIPLNRLL